MYWHKTPFWLKAIYPSFVWHQDRGKKKLYLTFDDGPIPKVTTFVLEQLALFNAKATFFCVGENIKKHPTIFSQIIEEGHRVGNHTHNHLNGWQEKDSDYLHNIKCCQDVIDTLANTNSTTKKLLRPPYGKIKRAQASAIKKTYKIIMWDVLSGDFDRKLKPELCLLNTIKATKNGSIIIFHDSIKAEKNLLYALPRFLDHFTKRGFDFQAL